MILFVDRMGVWAVSEELKLHFAPLFLHSIHSQGTSNKACHMEAMLHKLSLECNRIKKKQTKLERLSAGFMIDLQSSLITSDDHVVVLSPPGFRQSNSKSSLSLLSTNNRQLNTSSPNISLNDINISTCSKGGPSLPNQ